MPVSGYLGLDTSNYTTSVAFCDADSGAMVQQKRLLPVKTGEIGLRQSDAVFHHVRQLPEVIEALRREADGDLLAAAASDRPQERDGSYMPCFLVGAGMARQLGALLRIPVHFFTHQQGHIAAALTSADKLDLRHAPFLAFHMSGGTTDAVYVRPDRDKVFTCEIVACSLDLKAGQLIDRTGHMLGLPFPAGPALEALALQADDRQVPAPRPSMDGACCHLSGVENQCRSMLQNGRPPEEIALFCLKSIEAALFAMTDALLRRYGPLPLLYAGGVMSNSLLKKSLTEAFGGCFAPPAFSADNAAGIATLCRIKEEERASCR